MGKLNATISWSEEVHHELQLDFLCWPIERDRIVFLQQQLTGATERGTATDLEMTTVGRTSSSVTTSLPRFIFISFIR
jgi:hypothetical protein